MGNYKCKGGHGAKVAKWHEQWDIMTFFFGKYISIDQLFFLKALHGDMVVVMGELMSMSMGMHAYGG